MTQLIAFAGFLAMFFFLTLYMQNVLGYSAIQTGAAYLPLTFAIGIAAGISSQLLSRVGTRPVIVAGALIAAGGLYWLSRIPVHGSYLTDLLPGMLVLSLGFGPVFVGVTTAANAGVPPDKAGLAAALLERLAAARRRARLWRSSPRSPPPTRNHLLAAHTPPAQALTSGFQRALLVGSIFILASAVIALTRHQHPRRGTPPHCRSAPRPRPSMTRSIVGLLARGSGRAVRRRAPRRRS